MPKKNRSKIKMRKFNNLFTGKDNLKTKMSAIPNSEKKKTKDL